MACINIIKNNDTQQGLCMGPRISFSNDFGDAQHQGVMKVHSSNYKEAPVSADFEFSVTNQSLVANNNIADEFFFKGKLLPLKERKPTLRDELLVGDDDCEADILPRIPKSSSNRWKDKLGLRRSNFLSRKGDKNEAVLQSIVEEEKSVLDVVVHDVVVHDVVVHDKGHVRKKSQDMFTYGGLF